jgi:hypothetical protein
MLILKLVDLIAAGLLLIGEDKERYERLSKSIRKMVEEGREPTPEEEAELAAESEALTARILAARDSGNPV